MPGRRPPSKPGKPYVEYEPTADERARAVEWRAERTLRGAWRALRAFAASGGWSLDADLPPFDHDEHGLSEQPLTLHTRADARALIVCEKTVVLKALQGGLNRKPSIAHHHRLATACVRSLASSWSARLLRDHARSLGVPILFFGDLDPQTLHAFATLRSGGCDGPGGKARAAVPVQWLGVDGRWLSWAKRQDEGLDWRLMRQNWLHQEYWAFIKRLVPDVRRLIGPAGYSLLERGMKLETDALLLWGGADEFERRLTKALR
jgi:hypothetical protein